MSIFVAPRSLPGGSPQGCYSGLFHLQFCNSKTRTFKFVFLVEKSKVEDLLQKNWGAHQGCRRPRVKSILSQNFELGSHEHLIHQATGYLGGFDQTVYPVGMSAPCPQRPAPEPALPQAPVYTGQTWKCSWEVDPGDQTKDSRGIVERVLQGGFTATFMGLVCTQDCPSLGTIQTLHQKSFPRVVSMKLLFSHRKC